MNPQFAQGDLLFERISDNTQNSRALDAPYTMGLLLVHDKDNIIALGEKTGHAHVIEADKATLYEGFFRNLEQRGIVGIVVREEAKVTHDEHDSLTLKPGTYVVHRQRQFVPRGRADVPRARFD